MAIWFGKAPALLLVAAAAVGLAAPAEARLGASITTFKRSALLEGDTLFRYEGAIGGRYRFGGASRCRFGTGLLFVDTLSGTIVQQVLVLPLPASGRDERTLKEVARLFFEDAGLPREDRQQAETALEETLATGQGQSRSFRDDYELNTRLEPRANSVMIIVGLK